MKSDGVMVLPILRIIMLLVRSVFIAGNEDSILLARPNISSGSTGILTRKPLDRERSSSYQLVEKTVNTDEPAKVATIANNVLITDQNDNTPILKHKRHSINVSETLRVGSKVYSLNGVDVDQGRNHVVTYHLLAGSGYGIFGLNLTNGDLTLQKPLDREEQSSYTLFIARKHPDHTSYTEAVISVLDENDHRPEFITWRDNITISEDVPIGTSVTRVIAVDRDSGTNAELIYSYADNTTDHFSIDSFGVIRTAKLMDYEKHSRFNLTITVQDKGDPPLIALKLISIHVIIYDVNEHSPQFDISLYEKVIPEDLKVGESILKVHATDFDGNGYQNELTYSILDKSLEVVFQMNSSDGVVSIKRNLDFEETKTYQFYVLAKEKIKNPRIGTAKVIISVSDVNDNCPILLQKTYRVTVNENTPPGTRLTKVLALDIDSTNNGALKYHFAAGNEDSLFALEGHTGIITLTKYLAHEQKNHTLLINVSDKGIPSMNAKEAAKVFIRVAEDHEKPTFQSSVYVASIQENGDIGTSLLTLQAKFSNRGTEERLIYHFSAFTGSKVKELFDINPLTGVISTRVELDRETKESYRFAVVARETGVIHPHESFAQVLITVTDVNDNSPVFEEIYHNKPSSFLVGSDAPTGTFLLQVTATDKDSGPAGQVSYSIVGITGSTSSANNSSNSYECKNQSRGVFIIGQYSGVVIVASHLASLCLYTIRITARDHGTPSLSNLTTIRVQTTSRNVTTKLSPSFAFLSRTDVSTIVAVVSICSLVLAIVAALIICREARRQQKIKRKSAVARGGMLGRDFAISSSMSQGSCQWRYYDPTDDFDSDSSTAMAPSTPVSSRPSNTTDLDTDLLETFSLYDEREGHYTLHSRNQSFNISLDFSSEDLSPKSKKSKLTIRTNTFDQGQGNTTGKLSSDAEVHNRNEQRARKSNDTQIKANKRLGHDSSLYDIGRNSSEYETHL